MGTIREDRPPLAEDIKDNDKPTILVTTVDIGGGKSDTIAIRRGDDPADLARAFCDLHSLPDGVLGPLTEHLLDNLRKASKTISFSQASPGGAPDASSVAASPLPPMHMTESPLRPQRPLADDHSPHGDQDLSRMEMTFNGFSPEQPSRGLQQQQGSEPLSFSNPNDQNRLYEQLSAKMVQVDSKTMLTVSSDDGMRSSARKGNSARRNSQSADLGMRDSVHLRLYNKAQDQAKRAEARRAMQSAELAASVAATKTSMSWISAAMMRERTHGPFENYGEMLYAEGLEAQALRRSKAAAVKADRQSRELQGATFKPEITALARALYSGGDYQSQPAWQRLSSQNKSRMQERLQEIKKMQEMDEVKECTFKPVINSRSRAMMCDREDLLREMRMSAHEQLFQDAIRRQHKMEELSTWVPDDYTFKPVLNHDKMAQEHLRRSFEPTKANSPSKGMVPPVVERLYASHEKTKAKLEANRAKYHGPTDPVTGKPLYKPDMGRGPRSRQPSSSPQVHQLLYAQGLELMSKKEAAQDAERRQAEMDARTTHTLSTSDKLYKRLKLKRFAQIFEYLDEAHSDAGIDLVALVRQPTGHVENLDNEVREDVEIAAEVHAKASGVPLFPEGATSAEESAEALAALPPAPVVTLDGFVSLMEAAIQLRRGPRAYLVPSPSAKCNPEPTFRPEINPRSRELAARLRPAEVEAYEILYQQADASRAKLEEARRAQEEAELRECTFMPLINSASLAAEGRALRQASKPGSGGAQAMLSATPRTPRSNNNATAAQLMRSPQAKPEFDEDAQFLALEREVHEALAGASLTASQLDGSTVNLPAMTAALKAQLGNDVDPADLRATEEMLLDLLGGGGMDGEGEGDMESRISGLLSGGAQSALSLQELASELNQWDHRADPKMQTFKV